MYRILTVLILSLVATPALAQECTTTFPERLAATQTLARQWAKEAREYTAWQKSPEGRWVEFFSQHCRFLTGLETAIRRLDDPNEYVCNAPKPKGMPRGSKIIEVMQRGQQSTEGVRGELGQQNRRCESQDPISLVINNETGDASNGAKLAIVLCYGRDDQECRELTELAQKQLELIARRTAR